MALRAGCRASPQAVCAAAHPFQGDAPAGTLQLAGPGRSPGGWADPAARGGGTIGMRAFTVLQEVSRRGIVVALRCGLQCAHINPTGKACRAGHSGRYRMLASTVRLAENDTLPVCARHEHCPGDTARALLAWWSRSNLYRH